MAEFNLDWGEGASKSGNLYILPDRTDSTNKANKFHCDYRNRLIKVAKILALSAVTWCGVEA